MVVSVAMLGAGSDPARYYLSRQANCPADYYLGAEPTGRWLGSGVEAAGLSGWVDSAGAKSLRDLLAGHGDDLVYPREDGAPMHTDTPTALMPKLIAAAGLPHTRLHDLRHLHATTLLLAGVPVHVVASRLGHADPAITLRVYAHVLREQASGIADVFAAAVDG